MAASPSRISPGLARPDQSRAESQNPLAKPVVVRKESTVNTIPQSASNALMTSPPRSMVSAPTQWRRKSVAEMKATRASSIQSSGSRPSARRLPKALAPE